MTTYLKKKCNLQQLKIGDSPYMSKYKREQQNGNHNKEI